MSISMRHPRPSARRLPSSMGSGQTTSRNAATILGLRPIREHLPTTDLRLILHPPSPRSVSHSHAQAPQNPDPTCAQESTADTHQGSSHPQTRTSHQSPDHSQLSAHANQAPQTPAQGFEPQTRPPHPPPGPTSSATSVGHPPRHHSAARPSADRSAHRHHSSAHAPTPPRNRQASPASAAHPSDRSPYPRAAVSTRARSPRPHQSRSTRLTNLPHPNQNPADDQTHPRAPHQSHPRHPTRRGLRAHQTTTPARSAPSLPTTASLQACSPPGTTPPC